MVANGATINATHNTQNNSYMGASGRSSQEQSLNFKVAVYPPPVGARRPAKQNTTNRSPDLPFDESEASGFKSSFQPASKSNA